MAYVGQQPQMVQMQAQLPLEQWRHGICGCFDNCGNCLYAILCPCCAMASARSRFDESNFCFNCMCLTGPVLRNIIREGYHIQGNCISDILCASCLGGCSLCQVLNEVTARGMVKYTWGANRSPTPVDFQFGLCSCFSNCENCLYAWCCTHCAFASARSRFDSSNWLFNCCCLSPCLIRSIVREGYNIKGTCFHDICFPLLCPVCVAAQLLNEVGYRGEVSKTIIMVPKQ